MVAGLGKPLLPIVALLLVVPLALAAPCKPDFEFRAEMVIGFFVSQKVAAAVCEERYGLEGMEARAYEIESRHQERIGKAGEVREAMLRRIHGEKWREELYRVNKEFIHRTLKTPILSIWDQFAYVITDYRDKEVRPSIYTEFGDMCTAVKTATSAKTKRWYRR